MTTKERSEIEAAHRLRNQVQSIASLLNLHASMLASTPDVPDFLKKARMRLEVVAEISTLAIETSRDAAGMRALLESIHAIVARCFDAHHGAQLTIDVGDLNVGAQSLAILAQIYSELLAAILPHAAGATNALLAANGNGELSFSLFADPLAHGRAIEFDPLASRLVAGLAASADGGLWMDAPPRFGARLSLRDR